MRSRISSLMFTASVALFLQSAGARAQFIPPGADLPGGGIATMPGYKPPGTTQPGTGVIEPGPGYRPPGATVPRAMMPTYTPRTYVPPPAYRPLPRIKQLPRQSRRPERRAESQRGDGPLYPPAKSLAQCLSRWSPAARISRSEWEATCRRLEKHGRATDH